MWVVCWICQARLHFSFYIQLGSEQGLGPETSRALQSPLAITIQTAFNFCVALHNSLVVQVFFFSFDFHLRHVCSQRQGRGKQDCSWADMAALLQWSFLFEFQFRSVVNTRQLPWNVTGVCSGLVVWLCVVCSACSPTRASRTYYSDPLALISCPLSGQTAAARSAQPAMLGGCSVVTWVWILTWF